MKNNVEHITGDLQWDGLHRPKIYYAVASVCCGIFLSVVDGNICNVALPTISQELGVSSADSIWVVNAFQLVIMMTLLSFSSLGELFSYKRVYVSGVVLFTVGSLFCAMSHTLPLLIASRAFQGIGAAMMMSVNTTLVKIIYPKKYLGKGVGINATVVALAAVTGPTLAAGILSFASWPWLFAVNIPIGIVTFFMAFRHLPDNPTHVEGRHFNVRDALLNAAVFGLLIGCIEMYSHGASLTTVLVGAALLLLLGFIYVRTQLHRQYPMLPFDLLRIPVFSMSVLTSIVSFTAQMMALVAIPFMLLHTFGMNAVETGLLMTSWPLVIVFVAPLAGSLITRLLRPAADEYRLLPALVHSGGCLASGHSLEAGPLRYRLRFLPVAQQPHAPEFGPQPPGRKCGRHARHSPSCRSVHRRGPRRPLLPPIRERRTPRRHASGRSTDHLRRPLLRHPSRPPSTGE